MAKYQIKISRNAEKSLRKLPTKSVRTIRTKIRTLADNPRPDGCKKLVASDRLYRIRTGNYRILYTIADDVLIVTVVKIGDRKDVY